MTGGRLLRLALILAAPIAAKAQPIRVTGIVERPGSIPAGNARIVLHRIGVTSQGPIDTVLSDGLGRFSFDFQADGAATYLISARHAGIEYFSAPLAAKTTQPDTGLVLIVYDTSATVPVVTRSRTLVIGAPDATGGRTVVDWFGIENRGTLTRVGRDSAEPTWHALVPEGAREPQVGDARLSQISGEAVTFRNDTVFVTAPISPGQKELLIQYEIGKDQRSIEVLLGPIDSVDLFIEEPGLSPVAAGWRVRDSQMFEGRPFRRYQREGQQSPLTIRLPRTTLPAGVLPGLVALAGIGLFGGAWFLMRRRGLPAKTLGGVGQ